MEISGIYECKHEDGQRETITLIRGTRFLGCQECGDRVTYRLMHQAPYIYEDPDFAQ